MSATQITVNPIVKLDLLALMEKHKPKFNWSAYTVVEVEGSNQGVFFLKGAINSNMGWDQLETVDAKSGFSEDFTAFLRKYTGLPPAVLLRSAKVTLEAGCFVVCGLTIYLLNDPAETPIRHTHKDNEPIQDRMEDDAEQAQMKAGHA